MYIDEVMQPLLPVEMIIVCVFALVSVAVVNCQLSQIYIFNGERELNNNSYIYYASISDGDNALRCVTGVSDCCFDSKVRVWGRD